MFKRLSILILLIPLFIPTGCSPSSDGSDAARSAHGLAERITGGTARKFVFRQIDPTLDGRDIFTIESSKGKIIISGNSALSMSKGLGYYLKYYCHCAPGWFKDEGIELPSSLPKVKNPVKVRSRVEDRFFLNYCTFGYTMPWFRWEDWEHLIDWMALQGINLPLSITGQESIWYEVWTELGLDGDEVREYFTGPAHLPWHRMLNIDRWGGPLPKSWLREQAALQKKIVDRERELGMKPVLPAFSGHVPGFLKDKYPEAKITKMGSWCDFPDEDVPYFLDPMDPLFEEIQKLFVKKETEIYGSDHIYGIDLFNEMTPPEGSPEYLGRVSRQVYEALSAADPDAVWLQMTWLFWNERDYWTLDRVKPYITSYPSDRSILLDYYCDRQEVWRRTEKYFGVPYVWCYLGNFGGNTSLAGNIEEISEKIETTFMDGGENFKGIGSTLEGLDCNPFIYEFVFEKAWDSTFHENLDSYRNNLAKVRTGVDNEYSQMAWGSLIHEIYKDRSVPGHSPMLNLRPSFERSTSYHSSVKYSYDNETLFAVIDNLLLSCGKGSAYEFDLVNLTRQYLSNLFEKRFALYKEAYEMKYYDQMREISTEMMAIFDDLESILSTQSPFLLGKWIDDARSWGETEDEKNFFEQNARNLLTTWGDRGNLLTDYASRTWSGLVSSYYKARWEMFFDRVFACTLDHGEFNSEDEKDLLEEMEDFEKSWWEDRLGSFPSTPSGNSIDAVRKVITKYASER